MLRNILTLATGLAVSLILPGIGGMVLYRLSDRFSEFALGAIAHYAIGPAIGLGVAILVGALAKSYPKLLAALSLAPWVSHSLFYRTSNRAHYLTLLLMDLICVFLSIVAAAVVFKLRGRRKMTTVHG